jgi:nucleotide-binding universal stress UspA family protein
MIATNILIPTDFSKNSLNAFEYAIESFPTANFTFLHCVNIRQAGSTMVVDVNSEIKSIKQVQLDNLIEQMMSKYPRVSFNSKVEIGLFTQTINEEVEKSKIDLVFIGTKGVSGIEEVLIGSNASDAVRNVLVPLIVVPENVIIQKPNTIFLASDFTTESYENERKIIDKIRAYFDARLDLLHIQNKNDKIDGMSYSKIIESKEIDVYVEKSEDIEAEILNFAHTNNYDMIIVVPKDRGLIMNLFHRSITKKMSMHSDLPLFIWK